MPDNNGDCPATSELQIVNKPNVFFSFLVATGGRTPDDANVLIILIPIIVLLCIHLSARRQSSLHCHDRVAFYTATLT